MGTIRSAPPATVLRRAAELAYLRRIMRPHLKGPSLSVPPTLDAELPTVLTQPEVRQFDDSTVGQLQAVGDLPRGMRRGDAGPRPFPLAYACHAYCRRALHWLHPRQGKGCHHYHR